VASEISGQDNALVHAIQIEQVQAGRKAFLGAGMCGFPA
jgi:hypothetical protein